MFNELISYSLIVCLRFRKVPREPLCIVDCVSPVCGIPEVIPGYNRLCVSFLRESLGIVDCVSPVLGIIEGTPGYN